jgi:FAD synthase
MSSATEECEVTIDSKTENVIHSSPRSLRQLGSCSFEQTTAITNENVGQKYRALGKHYQLDGELVVGQMVVHRHDLKTKRAFLKHRQLRGQLVVGHMVVHRQECAANWALGKHYQLGGELVVGQVVVHRRVLRAIARLQQQHRLLLPFQRRLCLQLVRPLLGLRLARDLCAHGLLRALRFVQRLFV